MNADTLKTLMFCLICCCCLAGCGANVPEGVPETTGPVDPRIQRVGVGDAEAGEPTQRAEKLSMPAVE